MGLRLAVNTRLAFLFFTSMWSLITAPATNAATFNVTTTVDAVDNTIGNGICASRSGVCTLRAAIQEANTTITPDTIILPAGTYSLTVGANNENAAAQGDLDITNALTIVGAGQGATIISGNGIDRVFHILGVETEVTISQLSIADGTPAAADGGGILNEGNLTLSNVRLENNAVGSNRKGGAICTFGPLKLSDSLVINNQANGFGGGLFADNHFITITNTIFESNTAQESGGGVSVRGNANHGAIIINSIFDSNASAQEGGGLAIDGMDVYIQGGEFTNNSAELSGGGVSSNSSNIYIEQTLFDGNSAQFNGGALFATSVNTKAIVSRSTIINNSAASTFGGSGGGISSITQLSLINSTINGNSSTGEGGGLTIQAPVTITNSLISNNGAVTRGGGIYANANMIITNSTLSGNAATSQTIGNGRGGGIYFDNLEATLAVTDVTVFANDASAAATAGGGASASNIDNASGTVQLLRTIIAGAVTGDNCRGLVTSLNRNLSSDDSCGLAGANDLVNTDPALSALANNGGPTRSHAIASNSAARNAGGVINCADIDQRGFRRSDGTCDIGAFEFGSAAAIAGTLQFSAANYDVSESSGSVDISVTRTGGNQSAVTTFYTTLAQSAQTGSNADFTAVSGMLSWLIGDTSTKTISVPVHNVTAAERDEVFSVVLAGITGGAQLGTPSMATATILGDQLSHGEFLFDITGGPINVSETTSNFILTIARVNGSDGLTSVDFRVTGGSATKNADFTVSEGAIKFSQGQVARQITFAINNDDLIEGTETIQVSLSNPQGGAVLSANNTTATITLLDDEPPPGTIEFVSGSRILTLDENRTPNTVTLTVLRTGGSGGAISVNYIVGVGTTGKNALEGVDFTLANGTLNWADGDTANKSITFSLIDDNIYEGNEEFTVRLSLASGAAVIGQFNTARITIVENDIAPEFLFGTLSFEVGGLSYDESSGRVNIPVIRTDGSSGTVSVDYAIVASDSTAASNDFGFIAGTLTFGNGITRASIPLTVIDDMEIEPEETVIIRLSNAQGGANLGTPNEFTATILDNDGGNSTVSVFSFESPRYSKVENNVEVAVKVKRTGNTAGNASVSFNSSASTATEGADFSLRNGFTLEFADGETEKEIIVDIIDDFEVESQETVILTLVSPSEGAVLGTQFRTVISILDDDNSGKTEPQNGGGGALHPLILFAALLAICTARRRAKFRRR